MTPANARDRAIECRNENETSAVPAAAAAAASGPIGSQASASAIINAVKIHR